MPHKCLTCASLVPHKCLTSAPLVPHKCLTSASLVPHKCLTSASHKQEPHLVRLCRQFSRQAQVWLQGLRRSYLKTITKHECAALSNVLQCCAYSTYPTVTTGTALSLGVAYFSLISCWEWFSLHVVYLFCFLFFS